MPRAVRSDAECVCYVPPRPMPPWPSQVTSFDLDCRNRQEMLDREARRQPRAPHRPDPLCMTGDRIMDEIRRRLGEEQAETAEVEGAMDVFSLTHLRHKYTQMVDGVGCPKPPP